MHTSLDGFAAGPNREMNWIKVDDELFDFVGKLTDQADTALYGRATFQLMESYWPTAADRPNASRHDIEHSLWYKRVFKVVMSKTMKGKDDGKVRIIGTDIEGQIRQLKDQPGKDILMLGSPTAASFLTPKDLIDEYWFFINPVFIGSGMPFFKNTFEKINLKLAGSKIFSSGVIGAHYERIRIGR